MTPLVLAQQPSVVLRDSVAHELFHAVQEAVAPLVNDPWVLEGTAWAAEVALWTTDLTARLSARREGQWRQWSFPLNSTTATNEYEVGEFFLHYAGGSVGYLEPMFRALHELGRELAPQAGYGALDEILGLEPPYLELIENRSVDSAYPYENAGVVCGQAPHACDGSDSLVLADMSAQFFRVRLTEEEPTCPPDRVVEVSSVDRALSFTVVAGDSAKFAMIVGGVTIPPDTVVSLDADEVLVAMVHHDAHASVSGVYSFVAERTTHYDCVECDDGNLCTDDSIQSTAAGTTCIHTPTDCDDVNASTIDSCDPTVGCVHSPPLLCTKFPNQNWCGRLDADGTIADAECCTTAKPHCGHFTSPQDTRCVNTVEYQCADPATGDIFTVHPDSGKRWCSKQFVTGFCPGDDPPALQCDETDLCVQDASGDLRCEPRGTTREF